jgi:osmotically-inducible protein OsmY
MKRLLSTLGVAALCCATAAIAQQPTSPSSTDQSQSSASSAQTSPTQSTTPSAAQSNPAQAGAPDSTLPGRVNGATPTAVQQELDKQLPAGSQVTASVADDGSLKLTGTVSSDADKAKAEQIAKQTSNKNVDNQIQVKSSDQNSVPK